MIALSEASLLALALTFVVALPSEARTRGFCFLDVLIFSDDLHQQPCGRNEQVTCNSGAHCDAGFRGAYFADAGRSNITVGCGILPNEVVSGICVLCGGEGEVACAGNQCDGALGFVSTSGLNGPISACDELLPADPDNVVIQVPAQNYSPFYSSPAQTYNIGVPSTAAFLESYGTCSDGLPESLSGASRESWPSEESTGGDRGTAIILHGRGSTCSGMSALLQTDGGMLFERNHDTFCIEYDQNPSNLRVSVYQPAEQASGEGPLPCAAAGTCSFDLANPLFEVNASSYTVPNVAAAVARAVQAIPTRGTISLIAASQGGFIARALVHEHYDDLRWTGNEISRVVTLGHPYYGMVVDPSLATPWLCANDSTFDCSVLKWLWGWQDWLGSTAGSIDDDDFPQIEWTAVGGDGGLIVPGAMDSGPDVADTCLEIFGGGWAPDIDGDGGVSTASSLGVDELGFFSPVTALSFDAAPLVNCGHNSDCLLREALNLDPETVPIASPAGVPIPGALGFDGVDDEVGGLTSTQLDTLVITGAITLEAWIWPSATSQTSTILNKEGEYQLGLVEGELEWGLANSFPGWGWIESGFIPPIREWTHVAVAYDPAVGAIVYVDGVEFFSRLGDTGPIGDADVLDDFRIGAGENSSNGKFEGKLGEVRVWKRALAQAELRPALSHLVDVADPDLLGWWGFSEGTGDTLMDQSSYAHHLSLSAYGVPSTPDRLAEDRQRPGGALYFDGVNDFASISDAALLADLEMTSSLTIEAWINPRGPGGSGGGVIVNKEGEYALTRLPDGSIAFSLANSSPGWITTATLATAPEHTWTHIALAYQDGAPGSVEVYENGVLVDSISAVGVIGDFVSSQQELRVGGRQAVGNNQWFHGLLDEVRVWSVRRTPESVANLYDQVLADPSPAGLEAYWRFDQRTGSLVSDSSGAGHHASLGVTDGPNTPIRASGAALPDYPEGLMIVPEPSVALQLGTGIACMIGLALRRNPRGSGPANEWSR